MTEKDDIEGDMHQVGALIVQCPRCGTEITIPINAGVAKKDGKLYVRTDSDVADYWSHAWAHKEGLI